jgi:lipopolysaccharide/colanic/teichoic acid biosynthesis glycosyltransferase
VPGHLGRAARRLATFVAGDAAVLFVVTTILAAAGESELAGPSVARALADFLPGGEVPGAEIVVGIMICLLLIDSYEPVSHRQLAGRRVAATTLGLALPYWTFFWREPDLLLLCGFIILAALLALALLLGRETVERIAPLAGAGPGPVPVLLVARPDEVERARQYPALGNPKEYDVRGVFDPEMLRRRLGAREALGQAIRDSGADTVVLCCGALGDEAFEALQDAVLATGCQLMGLSRMRVVPGSEPRIAWSNGSPLLLLTQPAWRLGQMAFKRGFDIAGALVALALLAPVMALIAVAIKLDGPGPVFFAHKRVGLGGRIFRCFKFRSMRADAEQLLRGDAVLYAGYLQNDFKLPKGKDPRITRVGRLLRESSLDELPQLWNVLRGDMSLVGPRPIVPEELAEYEDTAPLLLSVKPGLAGAWAVNGRSEVRYPARADIELGYVRQWRVKLDLSLLARVLPAVLSRRGSH